MMKKLFRHFSAARDEGGRLWDDREAIASETKRAFREGPDRFRNADTRSKAIVVAIVVMVAVIIYKTI